MVLNGMRVDFMPDDAQILGFGNRWYKQAMETATTFKLTDEFIINLIHPVYFVATKLEAYKGRGGNDALTSRDIEDILNVVDGRPELLSELNRAPEAVQAYIAEEVFILLQDSNFEYAIASQASTAEREAVLFDRFEAIVRRRK